MSSFFYNCSLFPFLFILLYIKFPIFLCSFYNCPFVCFIFYSLYECFTFMSFLSLRISTANSGRVFVQPKSKTTRSSFVSTHIFRKVQANRQTKLPYTIRGTCVIDFLLRLTLFLLKMGYLYEIVFELLFRLHWSHKYEDVFYAIEDVTGLQPSLFLSAFI